MIQIHGGICFLNINCYFCRCSFIFFMRQYIVIKNPSKKVLDLMAQIAKDKKAKQEELRVLWESGKLESHKI